MYLTYEEYVGYGGTLPEADFNQAEFRARKRIDWLTDGRVAGMGDSPRPTATPLGEGGDSSRPMATPLREGGCVPEAVKLAMMAIIRADAVVGAEALADAPLVASFTTDGYSESYGSAAERTATLERQLNAEVRRLLFGVKDEAGVPLLYRGI